MNKPERIPRAVLKAIVKHSRDRAISAVCGKCSGLRARMLTAHPRLRADGSVRYGDCPWIGLAWTQTDEIARGVLEKLQWHGDHYAWTFAGMYIGIELDGYMHT